MKGLDALILVLLILNFKSVFVHVSRFTSAEGQPIHYSAASKKKNKKKTHTHRVSNETVSVRMYENYKMLPTQSQC